jgi:alcohol dehydrogenase, propanol-preferring
MAVTTPKSVTSKTKVGPYRAAVVHDFHSPLTLEEVPARPLQSGQIRVQVEASGLCHTDIHAAHGDWPVKPEPPFVPGHEGVGKVVEQARDVTEVTRGDRVAMPWLGYACGTCDHCVSGWETLCLEQKNMGYSIDGGFGEYATAYARYVVSVPEAVNSIDAAPLTLRYLVTRWPAIRFASACSFICVLMRIFVPSATRYESFL